MKRFFESIRSFFNPLRSRFLRKPKSEAAEAKQDAAAPASRPRRRIDRFTLISWTVTVLIVAALLGSAMYWKNVSASAPVSAPMPTTLPEEVLPQGSVPDPGSIQGGYSAIPRELQLKTNIPERPRYEEVTYRVSRGDAMLAIAEKFKIKSETILYVNKQLEDNPHNLKPGMELQIPPVDGLYYVWKEGDTFEAVAEKFDANPEDIITFPGNDIDLTDPKVNPGTLVMIPGGSRELRDWTQDLQTMARNPAGGTGTSEVGGSTCGGGPVAAGFGWPATAHSISGNPYGPGHLGIDITANTGDPVYAAGAGVVTMAQGGWNYGYGNVIQIDHGNGYVTVYAHLSQINVAVCQPVGQGTLIGLAGNTGNSFGSHLHFEVRVGGKNINPIEIVQ
jgi:murein DD-endopeptidase MepM/ murein hydrolase activator NlpD